jgi:hypothetical protein
MSRDCAGAKTPEGLSCSSLRARMQGAEEDQVKADRLRGAVDKGGFRPSGEARGRRAGEIPVEAFACEP